MIDHHRRLQLADDLLRRFASALRAAQLYSPAHPLVARNTAALTEALTVITGRQQSVTLGIVGGEFVVGDVPLPRSSGTMGDLMRRLERAGVERVVVDRDVTHGEIATLVAALARSDGRHGTPNGQVPPLPSLPHIQVGRIHVEQRVEASVADTASVRASYREAARLAEQIWEQTMAEGYPDPAAARGMVESLAQAVAQNRTALLALTALKSYDNYTFTHMVNVAILAMAQAGSLGIDGTLLREIGFSALMHDIGKVRTPPEILNKAGKLDEAEFAIMRQHPTHGAEILRRTPEIPPLAPVVAFEHHLRLNGTGYPAGLQRPILNLATVLCSIADVYDAMRSRRKYQQAFPSDRIKAVLERNDGQEFDQHLVRRFVQLIGIYPPGTLVRLDTGALGVVVRVHAPDPHRPRVRVINGSDGARLGRLYDVNLWEQPSGGEWPSAVVAPLDPAVYGLDPLEHL